MQALAVALVLASAATAACGPGAPGGARARTDATYDLAEDGDLLARRAELDAMAGDDPARSATRSLLLAEYARRMRSYLRAGDRADARGALFDLLSMWSAGELDGAAARQELDRHRPLLAEARASFARAGDDLGAAAVLAVLAWLAPRQAGHAAELEEIFAYGDALARARSGDGAELSRPIELLSEIAVHFPSREVVDRLVGMLLARRRSVEHMFKSAAASVELVRAHGEGVARTVWAIAAALARAERLPEVAAVVAAVTGLGDDRELKARLAAAQVANARAGAFELLAAWFRTTPARKGDERAVLAIARRGLARFPTAGRLHALAGEAARELERPLLAIRHYEAALARDPRTPGAAAALAGLYEQQIAELTQADRPRAGRALLARFEALSAAVGDGADLEPDLADARATLGRGLISLGELAEGRAQLERSLGERATLPALESLGTVALKQGRLDAAVTLFQRAMKVAGEGPTERYNRAKLFRPLGDALARAGRRAEATQTFEAGLEEWNAIGKELELPAQYVAESLAERGKILWQLGDRVTARQAFQAALDANPSASSTHADVVAFLVVRDEPEATLDAYLAGLGSSKVTDYFKVYMSLWVVAEALRRGEAPPTLARDFLAGRTGDLWPDQLARLATGRAGYAELLPRATTRGRLAELYYYTAVVGEARADPGRARGLLEQVLATDMVLFFEYDMADRWLREGPRP